MKYFQRYIILFAVTLSCLMTGTAMAKEKIIWHQPNLPPFFILSGKNMGEGIGDYLKTILLAELSEYDHKIIQANLTRTVRDMEKGRHICHMSLIPNLERKVFMDFSVPYTHLLPAGLIVAKNKMYKFSPFLNENGDLKLETMLAARELKAIYTRARFYPPSIMKAIEIYGKDGSGQLIEKIDVAKTDSRTELLMDDKLDGILGYPSVSYFYATENHMAELISYLRIENTKPTYAVHVACTKGDWNKKLMAKINAVIQRHVSKGTFVEATLRWLPKNSREILRQHLQPPAQNNQD